MATRPHRQSRPRCFRINHLTLALALLFTGADDHEAGFQSRWERPRGLLQGIGSGLSGLGEQALTHRIERSTDARGVTFALSGDIDSAHVTELEALMAAVSNHPVILDLADVTLANREAIGFLAGVEAAGAILINCPEYVRSWIDAEQGDA